MTSWLWLIEVLSINGVVSSSFRTNTISCAFVRNYDGPLLNLMMGFDQVSIVFFPPLSQPVYSKDFCTVNAQFPWNLNVVASLQRCLHCLAWVGTELVNTFSDFLYVPVFLSDFFLWDSTHERTKSVKCHSDTMYKLTSHQNTAGISV